ncbi:hypothetical protein AMS68_000927 [Peltaster fructicola]|uniref:Oxidoreductase-like domain-containing protein n=1 Tax=Peltaster fructicola TaxID=286661 RepID=A0A6H0XLM6_9PEZI|nr:hypothetical protein AMS68_000927 [Peltaster fructicola]
MRSQRALLIFRNLRRPKCSVVRTRNLNEDLRSYAKAAKDHPIDEVVDEQLHKALDDVQITTSEAPTSTTDTSARVSQRDEIIAKAQIVFGSKLQGPQRQAQLDARSKRVAGILVPPKPEEPDNCCMSGCVNCVWDMYRDEMEEWVAKSAEARARLEEQRAAAPVQALHNDAGSGDMAMSMDDDGGGSDTNWNDEGPIGGDMFEGIPVGIRAFMENEKRLKAKHKSESAASV